MESARPSSSWLRRTKFSIPTLAVVCLVLVVLSGACQSLPKDRIARSLAELPKNAAMEELSRLQFDADLGAGLQSYELVYTYVSGPNPGSGTPIVLVHNTPSTLYSWTELIYGSSSANSTPENGAFKGLARGHDVYAIEVIGHGIAPGDAAPYSFERCAKFVEAAIGALGLDKVHLVGSSYGGEFAWRAAVNAPERIASLVLLDSSGYPRRDGDWLSEEVLMRESRFAKFGWLLNSRSRVESALVPHLCPMPMNRVEEFFLVCENAHNWSAMIDLVRDENGSRAKDIPQIQVPTLILWGADDIAYDLDHYGRRFEREIPNAELLVVEGAGHYPHEQLPGIVAESMNTFYERVELGP